MNNTQLIISMSKNDIGIKKIASILNMSISDVQKILTENNINWKSERYKERDSKIIKLYDEKYKIKEIAEALNIDRHTVSKVLKENNIVEYTKKIDANEISKRDKRIIELYKSGLSMKKVSKEVGVSASTVSNVIKRYGETPREQHQKGHSKGTTKNRKYYFNQSIFETIDTEEKAYWLGFLYADGYVGYRGLVSLGLKESDLKHIELFRTFLGAEKINIKYYSKTKSYRINICSVKLASDLCLLGCEQKKSKTLTFPTSEIVPDNLIHHFMRGYFDGDGSIMINKKNKLVFHLCGTNDFLNGFEENMLKNINRKEPNKRIKNKEWSECVEAISYAKQKDIEKIFNYLYKDATIFLERKYEKFIAVLKQ